MNSKWISVLFLFTFLLTIHSCKKKTDPSPPAGSLQLAWTKMGSKTLSLEAPNTGLPVDSSITVSFNNKLDTNTVRAGIVLKTINQSLVVFKITYTNDFSTFRLTPIQSLDHGANYTLQINSGIKGANGETFPGVEYNFTTISGKMKIELITLNGVDFRGPSIPRNIDWKNINIQVRFSEVLDSSNYKPAFLLSGNNPLLFVLSDDKKAVTVSIVNQLMDLTKYNFTIMSSLKSLNGFAFDGFFNSFFTMLDSTSKFPLITDDELLTLIQQRTFRYFYDFAHPSCGLARERNSSGDIVTIGGSGFGVMALIVGIERGFITREQGLTRLNKILGFLETCDRFHGAWPHWLNGATGKVNPFSVNDNGADLVETSYMIEGLITMRQYLDPANSAEQTLINRIDTLTNAVEYDWFTRGQNVLYWHWSPNLGWIMNMQIRGYNETMITYVVAATSTTHPIGASVYHQGYAKNGGIKNGNSYYGFKLPLGDAYGGPLFFTHYSFLGLDPRTLQDQYANYWEQNVNQSLINQAYCMANPKKFIGYSSDCWGLTACDNPWGYNAHSPTNDLGTIAPTAAVSALPYTPEQSMRAIHHFYYLLGDKLWGEYGFYDSFDPTVGWWADSFLAIDQGPIICMIENYRTGLLWNLFMSSPQVDAGLVKLGFTH
ncbi:MAG: glucoamylase family protein [Bacteroidota bacterium]